MKLKTVVLFLGVLGSVINLVSCHNNGVKEDKKQLPANTIPVLPPAVTTLMQDVQQHPDSATLRFKLANVLDSMEHYPEALSQMDKLIQQDSANYSFYVTKAQILEETKDTLAAITTYLKALKIYGSPDAMLKLANLFAEQRNSLSVLISNDVKSMGLGREYDAHCDFITGVFYARKADREKAITFFNECISNDYTYMEAYIEKGMVYFDHQQYREALNVFQFASTVNNLYADAYYYMARCYEMMNMKDSAVLRFKQSYSLDKHLTQAQEALKRLDH